MEKLLYVIAIIIGIIRFIYGWHRYPYSLSKWKRNRMSDIEFFKERLSYSFSIALSGCVIFWLFYKYF